MTELKELRSCFPTSYSLKEERKRIRKKKGKKKEKKRREKRFVRFFFLFLIAVQCAMKDERLSDAVK